MYTTLRKIRKSKTAGILRVIFLTLFCFSILGISAYFIASIFLVRKPVIITPLAKPSETKKNGIENMLKNANLQFISIDATASSFFVVELASGGKVMLSKNKNIQEQIASLQLILSRLTIEGKRLKTLDFRFDRPIIEF